MRDAQTITLVHMSLMWRVICLKAALRAVSHTGSARKRREGFVLGSVRNWLTYYLLTNSQDHMRFINFTINEIDISIYDQLARFITSETSQNNPAK